MSFELVLIKEAQIDLDEIFIWYEEQRAGLGLKFIEGFEDTINKINRNPYYTINIEEGARSASLKKFPYEIIYRINETLQQIRIIAIIHQHRNPEWFKQRLK